MLEERENRDLIRRIDRYLSLGETNMSLVDYRFAQACRLPSSGLYSLEIALEITCNTVYIAEDYNKWDQIIRYVELAFT